MDLEPPYGAIVRAFRNGRVVPFLGAGVNQVLRNASPDVAKLPSGPELSRVLASLSKFPADSEQDIVDLAKVASYYVESSGRRSLREMLHETFNKDYTPCGIHEFLADIPRPMLIVTTNYDDLTERAFE